MKKARSSDRAFVIVWSQTSLTRLGALSAAVSGDPLAGEASGRSQWDRRGDTTRPDPAEP